MSGRTAGCLTAALTLLTTCCASVPGPPPGILYAHYRGPLAVTAEANENGVNGSGSATAWSLFGLFTFGDAGIDAAKRHGSPHPELVRVTHVDYAWTNVLGVGRLKVLVYFHDPGVLRP
jgi:hypothetical protein